jgi:hypothetical protein
MCWSISIFQYLMGISGAPAVLAEILRLLASAHWLFLTGVALMTMAFRMALEGLPWASTPAPTGPTSWRCSPA